MTRFTSTGVGFTAGLYDVRMTDRKPPRHAGHADIIRDLVDGETGR